MATHWSATGEANGWSSRLWGAWLLPLIMAVTFLILRAIPHIDPRRANYAKFSGMYDALIILILGFLLVTHCVILAGAAGVPVRVDRIMMPLVGVFIAAIGFLVPHAHPNWFVGIRTPWTLTSDLAWERTHKIGGPLLVVFGILMIGAGFIEPERVIWVLVTAAVALVVFLFVYSYRVWKTDPSKR